VLANPAILPVIITVACLIPFVNKAFHIDDPLFIWSAKRIQNKPFDFYGFKTNWYGTEMPMAEVTKNPPGACYYIAMVGKLFGWGEIVLHLAFLVPAVVAALGMYYLARQFCSQPVLATLAAVLTPGFLVSSTNIMCDTMMLASWVWAIFFWVLGIKANKRLHLLIAAVLTAICALTKYFGISLLGLLFVYSVIERRKMGVWVLFFLIPVIILAGYQWATHSLYGRGLLLDAVSFATKQRGTGGTGLFSKGLIGLAFSGGCIMTVLFYVPLLWSKRVIIVGAILMILLIIILASAKKIGRTPTHHIDSVRWGFLIQVVLMAVGGASILALAGVDIRQHRDADSLLLLLWVLGTFIFAGFINWVVNARSILPMVPAAGILLVRRIEGLEKTRGKMRMWRTAWPLVPAAVVALSVGWADYAWANTARSAAKTISKNFENYKGDIWFQGHWGFQYYMESNGHKAFDFKHSKPVSGDITIVPSNNCFSWNLPQKDFLLLQTFQVEPLRWLGIMNLTLGAAFYADIWGPIPFAVGPVDVEKYRAYIVR
jgi:hypothetical protein